MALFELSLEDNLFQLYEMLKAEKWKPDSYVSFNIADPKPRVIHKASVRDRLLYQAIYRKLYPIFDPTFIYDSYSSRNYKGTHAGVKKLKYFIKRESANWRRKAFVFQCDIKKFFDSIDHQILLSLIACKVKDERLMFLIRKIVDSFSTKLGKGLPLGNVTSQLFANVYLNELDQFVKRTLGEQLYIRYCDDFLIVSGNHARLIQLVSELRSFLEERLMLNVHERKIKIRKVHWGIDFLGYVILPHRCVLRTRTKQRVIKKLKGILGKHDKSEKSLSVLKQLTDSYLSLLIHSKGKKLEKVFREAASFIV